jgi:hypothetical protein
VTRPQFQRLLETYGADLQRWPEAHRRAARALIGQDDAARAALQAAARLDALLDRFDPPAPPDAAARITAVLRALPPQGGGAELDDRPIAGRGPGWAAALAELWWELRAVPRIPSMVAAVLLGLVVGFASLGLAHLGGGHVDLSALLFEPTPSDWLQL